MKLSMLAAAFVAVTFVSAQPPNPSGGGNGWPGDGDDLGDEDGPGNSGSLVGADCGSLPPRFRDSCCATKTVDPSCTPTNHPGDSGNGDGGDGSGGDGNGGGGQGPLSSGSTCASRGPEYFLECCKTAVDDPSCPPLGGSCGEWGCGMTTSIVTTTEDVTVSQCVEIVTNCPYEPVTTSTVYELTTICPVEAATTPPVSTVVSGDMVTSVVYTTQEETITECPADVTDCPARVVTSTVPAFTTICPESEIVPPPQTAVVPPPNTEVASPATTEVSAMTSEVVIVPPPNTEIAATSEGVMVPPPNTEVPPPATETSVPSVTGPIPPSVDVASSAGSIVANQTTPPILEFTGSADFNKAGAWGIAALFLAWLL